MVGTDPMGPPTPAYVRMIIDHFSAAVAAEMDRVEAEIRDSGRATDIYWNRYSADVFLDRRSIWAERLALGFVQVRTVVGGRMSVMVKVDLGTGVVWSEGWSPERER